MLLGMTESFSIVPRGAFSLRELALFGFGQRMRPAGLGTREGEWDGVMRLAFCLDGTYEQVGVEVRQDDAGVHGTFHGDADIAAVRAQVARVLSLEHDATGYESVGERDPVIGRLLAAAPGLRPPLFHSPYEAAVWSTLSARRPGWQMDRVRADLSRTHGAVFDLAGVEVAALPGPSALLGVDSFEHVDDTRLSRMRGVARAALDGVLDVMTLRAMDPHDAMTHLQQITGIGPFYAGLIVIRALGHTDVLPTQDRQALELTRRLYDLPAPPDAREFARIAEAWRPWRTWCTVLLRSTAKRILDG